MLLQKAKVVTTPTAYSDGFLHSVKPNVVLGDELVVNGTFDTDSDWTKGTGWTISGGKANCDGSQTSTSPLYQNAGLTIGAAYKVIVTISNYSAGNIRILMGGSTFGEWVNSNGEKTFILVQSFDQRIYVQADANFVGSIDNVSVKEKLDADFTFTRNSSATRVGEDGYIQDVATDLPRINYEGFDYDNGLPIYGSGKGHLLLEGQSTNIAYQGGGLSAVGASETSNFGISPSGENNSTKLESTVSSVSYVRTSGLSTLGTQACSIFVKKGIGDYIQLLQSGDGNHYANYDLVNGVVTAEGSTTTASIESYGDWLRLIAVFDSVSVGGGSFRCYLSDNPTAGFGGASSAVGNYIEYWGFQVEIGDYATSYIANTTPSTTVTRAAETCNNAGNADLFDSEGVLYADIAALANDLTQRQISIDAGGDTNNRIIIRYNDISNNINAYAYSGSVQGYFNYVADDITEFNKVAIRYKDNDFSFWVNGVQVATDTSGTAPTGLASLQFDFGGSFNFYGKTKMVAVFPYLSNDEMECLTTI
jgi:hypothetical protein